MKNNSKCTVVKFNKPIDGYIYRITGTLYSNEEVLCSLNQFFKNINIYNIYSDEEVFYDFGVNFIKKIF